MHAIKLVISRQGDESRCTNGVLFETERKECRNEGWQNNDAVQNS